MSDNIDSINAVIDLYQSQAFFVSPKMYKKDFQEL